jgi:tetratricopeptide (TPR) repeat protein
MSKKKKFAKKSKPRISVRKTKIPAWWKDTKLLYPVLIVLVISFAVLYPSLQNEFVNWDDDRNFYENELIVDLNEDNFWQNTKKIFQTPVIGNYNPLTIFTFALEKYFFGLDSPFYWHLDNLLLHLLCTFLVYRLGLLLGLKSGAIILALLFGIHPMRVESVAWVTERKDVLFGCFYITALIFYVKQQLSGQRNKHLIPIIIFFILALLSKIQAVTLPLSMLAIDYWLNRKISLRRIWEKWYYFIISLAFGLLGIFMLGEQGSFESNETYPLYDRIFVGSYSYLVYLVKSIFPFRLSPLYPYPASVPWYFYVSILTVPAYLILLYYAWKRNWKAIVFGTVFFTVNIIFLLQILGAGQGFLADRFTYIPYIGLFFIFAYYSEKYLFESRKLKNLALVSWAVYLLVLGSISWNQTKIWKNSGTLWTHVLKYYENITLPYGNRANYYRGIGANNKALADYAATIRLKPEKPGPYNSRARLYFNSNNPDTLVLALKDYNKAIQLEPDNAEFLANRAAVYARLNQTQNALDDLSASIRINPNFANSYLNRSVIYNGMKDYNRAFDDIQSYIKLKPYAPQMWYESGRLHRLLNRPVQAIEDLTKSIRYDPNRGLAYYERSINHYMLKQFPQAKADLNRARQLGVQIDQKYAAELNRQ